VSRIIGIDVSKWQGVVPWADVAAAGVRFAYLKATNGTTRDREFAANWRCSKGYVPRGAYLWLTDEDPRRQAEAAVALLDTSQDRGEMPLAIDVEEPSSRFRGGALVEHVMDCAERIRALDGRDPVIYSGAWYLDGRCTPADLGELVERFAYWHAQYPRTTLADRRACAMLPPNLSGPTLPKAWQMRGARATLWQFDGDGGCLLPNGVDADFNEWLGTEEDFAIFCGAPVTREAAPGKVVVVPDLRDALARDYDGVP